MADSIVSGESGIRMYHKAFPVREASGSFRRPDPSVRGNEAKTTSSPPREIKPTDDLAKDAVLDVAEALGAIAKVLDRKLSFMVDDETGRITIRVVDKETEEVIRSIPPEDISKMRESMGALVGLIYSDMS